MNRPRVHRRPIGVAAAALVFACTIGVQAADLSLTLSGGQEVPPVNTTARGSGTVKVNDDGTVSGSVNTTGIQATAAHIHSGASGKNGPVVIALSKGSNGNWMVPANAKLTPDQLKLFKSGELYVNVHSAAHPDGEIRAQLK